MGLSLTRLELTDWRSFTERTFEFSEGLNVLVGPNATGKTNTVEAAQLLTAGISFRSPRPPELVRQGCERSRARGRLEGDGRIVDVGCTVEGGRRRFERNGKSARAQDLSATLMSVLFNPDDLDIVKRSASSRRQALDTFGSCVSASFGKVCRSYQRALEQRNRLLKEPRPNIALIDAWSDQIALGGATLLRARMALFGRLSSHMSEIYAEVGSGEPLACSYVSSLGEGLEGMSRDELRDLFLARLVESREEELRRRVTLVGPQRDDVVFLIDGRDARTFGSQGQQRSVVLAWKMAETRVSTDVLGSRPLLLLDDVMSELDESRRASLTRLAQGGMQCVVTTSTLEYFPRQMLDDAQVITFGE